MKLGSILMIVLISFTLISHTYGDNQICRKRIIVAGVCGKDVACDQLFIKYFGGNSNPKDCTCTNLKPFNRECQCNVICTQ